MGGDIPPFPNSAALVTGDWWPVSFPRSSCDAPSRLGPNGASQAKSVDRGQAGPRLLRQRVNEQSHEFARLMIDPIPPDHASVQKTRYYPTNLSGVPRQFPRVASITELPMLTKNKPGPARLLCQGLFLTRQRFVHAVGVVCGVLPDRPCLSSRPVGAAPEPRRLGLERHDTHWIIDNRDAASGGGLCALSSSRAVWWRRDDSSHWSCR